MPRAAFRLPLAALAGATLLGTGAWLVRGERSPTAGPGASAEAPSHVAEAGPIPAGFAPRTGFDLRNTDFGPPPGVMDPPAGHAGRSARMDDVTDIPVDH